MFNTIKCDEQKKGRANSMGIMAAAAALELKKLDLMNENHFFYGNEQNRKKTQDLRKDRRTKQKKDDDGARDDFGACDDVVGKKHEGKKFCWGKMKSSFLSLFCDAI